MMHPHFCHFFDRTDRQLSCEHRLLRLVQTTHNKSILNKYATNMLKKCIKGYKLTLEDYESINKMVLSYLKDIHDIDNCYEFVQNV
jgi:hypothetical protein